MAIGPALRRLWRHAAFRRLLTVRVLSQAADGTLQVGMASYILFSPQTQPNAWAIAAVLALTLLPFTLVGPFVSTYLDRWSRRQVAVISDTIRCALAVVIGGIIAGDLTDGGWQVALFAALLVAMSINRFMLAGLAAGMQHTVDADEYLSASSILPTVGPLGVVIGAALGFAARAGLGPFLPSHQADAVVFWVAAVGFACSVMVSRRFAHDALGPEPGQARTKARDVLVGLGAAWRHLNHRAPAALGLAGMFFSRVLFGLLSVIVILALRNHYHTDPAPALADLTVWGLLTGAGFISATPFVPLLARRLGLRRTAVAVLLLGGIAQSFTALIPQKWTLFVVSFFIGLAAQSFKICVDTLVQAHIDEEFKGRVFVFYDVLFNLAFVLAAVLAALVLPPQGLSAVAFVLMAVAWVVLGIGFGAGALLIGRAAFERGTGDVTGADAPANPPGATGLSAAEARTD
ncbi:MFS transporter [Tessaracoccus sp. OS52]|uniref:MFS transporter n=1 Tax=Tessaracoccus sp. OS52 TaxID=2886691 RepID=UPI001D1183C2|nr:MFS transporter [Tessaracoccus sp. OS52]